MELKLTVGGDPDGGWLVDVHDGDRHGLYRPDGSHKTVAQAALAALVEHDPDLNEAMHKHDEDMVAKAKDAWEKEHAAPASLPASAKPVLPGAVEFGSQASSAQMNVGQEAIQSSMAKADIEMRIAAVRHAMDEQRQAAAQDNGGAEVNKV